MHPPSRFASIGFGNSINTARVLAVLHPTSASAKRRLKQAKESGAYIDATSKRGIKAL